MTKASVIKTVWAACLLIGGVNHASTLLRHGVFWDYGGVSWASALYWSSLTVVDPIVAFLLFYRPKIGAVATALLIATNVVHNIAVTAHFAPSGAIFERLANPFIASQTGFMLFVAATFRIVWIDAIARETGLSSDR